MKFSRFYESILIIFIIILFFRLAITSDNLINLSHASIEVEITPATINTVQINHPELLIGPVEGTCSNDDKLNKSNHSSRVTTTNQFFDNSDPLDPNGVISSSIAYQDGIQKINTQNNPSAIFFNNQNNFMFIEGEIIN